MSNSIKATGIVRPVDKLGRIVIPKELTRTFEIVAGESTMEIYVDGDNIVLRKYQPSCIFCGSLENTGMFKGKIVCQSCARTLSRIK